MAKTRKQENKKTKKQKNKKTKKQIFGQYIVICGSWD